ncbi:general secretion pathway protein N [Luteibacter sp. Sphag1AF]|uniref:type II secretion system protein N n=1 Tax=Luteibacter sp. Sphag1AF TaxID=2587031 RepID=UPI00161E9AC1|nr:type II secretion system protein N [Luteibacter sp. Sphag1AF]MBB3225738.1 general secretion pathway protein N [Luteibacter sp. Sphag1AF]
MKWIRWVVVIVLFLCVTLGLLYWFLPASLAVGLLGSRLHGMTFSGVSGSLWKGHAQSIVLPDGVALGAADWELGRDVVLGRTHLVLHIEGPSGRFDGRYDQVTADSRAWHDVSFDMDAAVLTPAMGDLRPRGRLSGNVPEALMQGSWPMTMRANLHWADASVGTPEGQVMLGRLDLDASSAAGVVKATLGDDGNGSVQIRGAMMASPIGWRGQLTLKPRIADTATRHFIARYGVPGADGTVHIQRKAGLAPAEMP